VGQVSDPVETVRAFYVFHLIKRLQPETQSHDEAKDILLQKVREEKRKQLAFQKAEEIQKEALKQNNLKKAAKKFDQEINVTQEFTRNSYLPQFAPEVIGAAFALTSDRKISPPVATENGAYILELVSKSEIDLTGFEAVKDSLRTELSGKKQTSTFQLWYTQLKEKAEIESYLDEYYPY
jgi:parvulin-like peptidyl-prolyl isomerase